MLFPAGVIDFIRNDLVSCKPFGVTPPPPPTASPKGAHLPARPSRKNHHRAPRIRTNRIQLCNFGVFVYRSSEKRCGIPHTSELFRRKSAMKRSCHCRRVNANVLFNVFVRKALRPNCASQLQNIAKIASVPISCWTPGKGLGLQKWTLALFFVLLGMENGGPATVTVWREVRKATARLVQSLLATRLCWRLRKRRFSFRQILAQENTDYNRNGSQYRHILRHTQPLNPTQSDALLSRWRLTKSNGTKLSDSLCAVLRLTGSSKLLYL